MDVPARVDAFVARAPGFVTVAGTRARRGEAGLIVALPSHGYTLIVGDAATGQPLTAARVTPVPSDALHAQLESTRLKLVPDAVFVSGALASMSTDRSGYATFADLPGPELVDALVTRPGYRDRRVSFGAQAGGHLSVWLEPSEADRGCHGRVIDVNGEPLSGAWVARGADSVRTAQDGSFTLPRTSAIIAPERESEFIDAYDPSVGATRVRWSGDDSRPLEIRIPRAEPPVAVRLLTRAEDGELQPLSAARVLPATPSGRTNFSGPFWRTAQSNDRGVIELPAGMEGTRMVAYGKGGGEIGRFLLSSGDVEVR
jgi:hypothetical protein